MLCSSAEELRAVIPNVLGSIPGVTCFFLLLFRICGAILVHGTGVDFGVPGTVSTPPDLSLWYDVLQYLAITCHPHRRYFLFRGGKSWSDLSTRYLCRFWGRCLRQISFFLVIFVRV